MSQYETILYEEKSHVAYVTLNRPDVLNAFNKKMQEELSQIWKSLRLNEDVHCVVLTAAGQKAFCTGIDRSEVPDESSQHKYISQTSNPFMFDDPGENLGPKQCDLWKPVIGAVNGMACGGAFYLLSEADIIICSENATFFDPHVTYGMASVYEPILMLQKMPFGEIMRLTLLGSHEHLSAKRALEIGLVSEVLPVEKLQASAQNLAELIASQPPLAVQASLRALWMGHELSRLQAMSTSPAILGSGNTLDSVAEGQKVFSSGQRIKPRIR